MMCLEFNLGEAYMYHLLKDVTMQKIIRMAKTIFFFNFTKKTN